MNDVSSFSLSGKVIVLCGGSGLLGRALVSAIGASGATLIITSRDRAKAEAAAAAERGAGRSTLAEELDFGSEAAAFALRDRVLAVHGRIDGLVYNAVSRPMRHFDDELARWEDSMATNATGYFVVVRALGNAMAGRGSGSIVSIASMYGMIGSNPWLYEGTDMKTAPDYFFHKGGMINFTRYLAAHYGLRGVRANAVAPGGIYNPEKPPPAEFLNRFAKMTALGRMASAPEICGAVVFLLSDAASYVTGVTLMVDGGYTAR